MSLVNDLVNEARKFLKDTWNEDTMSMTITKNEVVDGGGYLHTNCVVKLGGSTSKWHKIFTFRNGKVIDEKYHLF